MSQPAAIVMGLLDAAGAEARYPGLRQALEAALSALSRPPERFEVAEAALRAAVAEALGLPEPQTFLPRLGAALDGVLASQPRATLLAPALPGAAPAPTEEVLLASAGELQRWPSSVDWELRPATPVEAAELAPDAEPALDDLDGEPSVAREPSAELAPVDELRCREPSAAPAPLVSVVPAAGAPLARAEVHAQRLVRCLDSLGMHGRFRHTGPLAASAAEEERLLAWLDAARVQTAALPGVLLDHARRVVRPDDATRVFGPLLVVASFDGDGPLAVVGTLFGEPSLGGAPVALPAIAAEALAIAAHPRLGALAHDLARAPSPCARGLAIELGHVLGSLEPAVLSAGLSDPAPVVACAAARAAPVAGDPAVEGALVRMLGHPHGEVAWYAARALCILGRPEPLAKLRGDAAFAVRLGPRLADLVALAGGPGDEALLAQAVRRLPPSRTLLRALARFGHARTWLFFSHFLADPDFADDAADALELLFGPLVGEDERLLAQAWRSALTLRRYAPEVRLWRGEPWHPGRLGAEIASGQVSRVDVEAWSDELAARSELRVRPRLWPLVAERDASLVELGAAAAKLARARAGSWETRR